MDDRLMYRRELYIGGRWVPPAGTERFGVVSPSTEEVVGEVPVTTNADVDLAIEAARLAVDEACAHRSGATIKLASARSC